MAHCPHCNQEWRWDWCQDTYRQPNGKACALRDDGTMTCICGLSLGIITEDGEVVNHIPAWNSLDWEASEHSYPYE